MSLNLTDLSHDGLLRRINAITGLVAHAAWAAFQVYCKVE